MKVDLLQAEIELDAVRATTDPIFSTEWIERLGDRSPTIQNLVDVSIDSIRKRIYQKYPASDPKVIEALLLMYRNLIESAIKELGEFSMNSIEGINRKAERFLSEIEMVNEAILKTLATLNGDDDR